MNKLTKIIATIGPACDSPEQLTQLIKLGVNVFRFNFKHNTVAWHSERINRVNEAANKLKVKIGTLIDLQGPEIRLKMPVDSLNLKSGTEIILSEKVFVKPQAGFSLTHPSIIPHLKKDQTILADDGVFRFMVISSSRSECRLRVINGGQLGNNKTLNFPGASFPLPVLIERDLEGLQLAAKYEIDYIALSFVRDATDILVLKKELKKNKIKSQIVAKIETEQAINNLDSIINQADAVMVARGDLGVEMSLEQVPYYQKLIIQKCLLKRKAVITATQMLQSMIANPFPTRAEVSDIANAVWPTITSVSTRPTRTSSAAPALRCASPSSPTPA
jgi:pyruvate kinase